jgi:hypothetical protein
MTMTGEISGSGHRIKAALIRGGGGRRRLGEGLI